jgi:hypothetical protein
MKGAKTMRGIIRGFQLIDYVKKETNERVKGLTLYLNCPNSDVIGYMNKDEFIKAGTAVYSVLEPYLSGDIDSLIGAECLIDYDVTRRGSYTRTSINSLEILKTADKAEKKGA